MLPLGVSNTVGWVADSVDLDWIAGSDLGLHVCSGLSVRIIRLNTLVLANDTVNS